jgi:hypothetical protein
MDFRSTVSELCAIFSDMQPSHYTISMHLYRPVLNLDEEKHFSPMRTDTHYEFRRTTLQRDCRYTSTCTLPVLSAPPTEDRNVSLTYDGVVALMLYDSTLLISEDPGGLAVYRVGLRMLACWDCGIESRRGNGYLSLVNVVCCQLKVCASG